MLLSKRIRVLRLIRCGGKISNMRVFDYIPELNCFKINETFSQFVYSLGYDEWNTVVWIGRLFSLNNDFGEHWFDNWELRENIEFKATLLDYNAEELYIIDPQRFSRGDDSPCYDEESVKVFWTNVLRNLDLDESTIKKIISAQKINLKK